MLVLIEILFWTHVAITIFNLVGWMFARVRGLHFVSINITAFSWIGLGYLYGWGYCFLTDIHWYLLRLAGESNLPNSFLVYAFNRLFGSSPPAALVDFAIGALGGIAFLISWAWMLFRK